MDKIIKVLEENRMYNDYNNKIEFFNEIEFFKNYKLNKTSIHKIPSYIKRNKDGLLMLDDTTFIKNTFSESEGHNNAYWLLLDNGSKILLKDVEYDEICMELLFMEFANAINIPNAKYDVATLNGKTYLASICFTSVDDLLFDYYDLKGKPEINIVDLIKKAKKINQEEFIKKMLIIDLLTNNKDRFPNNLRAIIRNKNYIICPLFDNGLCTLGKKNFYTLPSYKNSTNTKDIISFLLEDKNINNWYLNTVLNVDVSNLKERLMKNKKFFIDDSINDLFCKTIENTKELVRYIK